MLLQLLNRLQSNKDIQFYCKILNVHKIKNDEILNTVLFLKTRIEQVYENHMPNLSHFQMLTISESLSSCLRVCSVKCLLSFIQR